MRQRITTFILSIVMLSVMLSMTLLHFIYYDKINEQVNKEFEAIAKIASNLIDYNDNIDLSVIDENVRIINVDGAVVYKNYKNYDSVNTQYVDEALKNGKSESVVYSNTFATQLYNYYYKINDTLVIEMFKFANEMNAIYNSYIIGLILVFLFVLLICGIFSFMFIKNLIDSIYETDLEEKEHHYVELQPFIKKIKRQKKELEKTQNEKNASEDMAYDIINSIKEGVLILDKSLYIKVYNKSVKKILKSNKIDYTNKHILEVLRDKSFIENVNKAKNGQEIDYSLKINNKTYRILMSIINNAENEKDILILFVDITSMVNAENVRHEFTANVSHELKTPLTSILGYSELILSGMVPEHKQMEFVNKIKRETDNLAVLVDDIILLSKLDENLKKELKQFNVSNTIFYAIERLQQQLEKKDVVVEFKQKDVTYLGNEKLFGILIYNLINNAIKYNVNNGKIFIKIKEDNESISIKIKDTGIGMSNEHLDRIFERFYRVDSSRNLKTGGTGLGLSIVKKVIKYHDGKIYVKSKIGEGSTFTVVLNKRL